MCRIVDHRSVEAYDHARTAGACLGLLETVAAAACGLQQAVVVQAQEVGQRERGQAGRREMRHGLTSGRPGWRLDVGQDRSTGRQRADGVCGVCGVGRGMGREGSVS